MTDVKASPCPELRAPLILRVQCTLASTVLSHRGSEPNTRAQVHKNRDVARQASLLHCAQLGSEPQPADRAIQRDAVEFSQN